MRREYFLIGFLSAALLTIPKCPGNRDEQPINRRTIEQTVEEISSKIIQKSESEKDKKSPEKEADKSSGPEPYMLKSPKQKQEHQTSLQKLITAIGEQRYQAVQDSAEKKAIWDKYWANAYPYILDGIADLYNQEIEQGKILDISDIDEKKMKDYLNYFIWMDSNPNNLTPEDRNVIKKHDDLLKHLQ